MAWVVRNCRILVRLSTVDHVVCKKNFYSNTFLKCQQAFHESKSRFAKKESAFSMRKAVIAVCCFGIGGGVYGYMSAMPDRKHRILEPKMVEYSESTIIPHIPDIEPSRKIEGPATNTDLQLTLFQYQTCPFCCKVRAFLGYYGIPFDVVEVNPVMRQQLNFSKYKKVPILLAHDRKSNTQHQLNDSSVIISILGTYLMDIKGGLQSALKYYVPVVYTNEEGIEITEVTNKYFLMYAEKSTDGRTYEDINRERKWRRWADSELVHVLSPNIYRTYEEAKQAFNYFSHVGEWEKNFSYFERLVVIYVGATAMYFIGKKLKRKYSLKDDVRDSLYDACKVWLKEIGPNAKFLGGESPNIADLEIYGLFSSIEGCSAFADALSHTNIGPWYYRVKRAVEKHDGYSSLISSKP